MVDRVSVAGKGRCQQPSALDRRAHGRDHAFLDRRMTRVRAACCLHVIAPPLMHDRNSRAAKWPGDARAPEVSSEFGPEEAPTRPSNAQLSAGFGAKPPLVRRQSAKIRKIAAPATP